MTERRTFRSDRRLKLLDLFSGIGGFSLGLEASGHFKTVAFCEIEPFPQSVLRKHWPEVPIYDDVRTLDGERLRADGIVVDAICGGFPCQDISSAGSKIGISGARSGLWAEYARLIRELRPRVVFVENVASLLGRGLDRVLGDLAAVGYDAEWHCIPASAVGAPHHRDRTWIAAYPNDQGQPVSAFNGEEARRMCALSEAFAKCVWSDFPDDSRMDDGVSGRMDRIDAIGNAVVPAIPEILGRVFGSDL